MTPKQEGEVLLIDCMKLGRNVQDYLNTLGLATDDRVGGKHHFHVPSAQRLYQSVTEIVAHSTLPADLQDLRIAYSETDCLIKESQSLAATYGFIWRDDHRRSATNELRISQPDDGAS